MPARDPDERTMISRIAALKQHAFHVKDPKAHTAPAVRALLAKFEREVDPEGRLDPAERARRARLAQRAHLESIRLASHQAQRRNIAARKAAQEADAATGAA